MTKLEEGRNKNVTIIIAPMHFSILSFLLACCGGPSKKSGINNLVK
tara:strand:+ start:75 stop:212 length:138 start_codon:yes stop_codon:yes gene_type:complete